MVRTMRTIQKMRTIFFDFGGTLDYPRHWLDRFLTHYHTAGINLTRAQLDLGFDHATRVAYRSTQALADYGLVELIDYLVRLQIAFLGRHGPEELRENLATVAGGRRLDEVAGWITQSFVAESREGFATSRKLLKVLSGRFRMGIVSNFYGNLGNILAEADLAGFFGAVADSSQLEIFKPDPRIFTYAMERLGSVPSETAMVGDSLGKDCLPAQKLGITAIWLRNPQPDGEKTEITERTQFSQAFTIDTLAELEHLKWWRL
jgi:HAD superfamily hydrolase (TIGR01549 family)